VRILLASDYYPPYIGGAQIQTHLLARELRDRGHVVAVATVWQDALPSFQNEEDIEIYRLRQLRTLPLFVRRQFQHHQPPFPDPVTAFALRRVVRRFKPDIVHSYGWISYSAAAALLGMDIPLLLTARDYGYGCATRTLVRDGQSCDGPSLVKCLGCSGRHYGRPKGWMAAAGVIGSRPLLRRATSGVHSISTYVRDVMRRDFLDERISRASGHVIHDVIGSAPPAHPEVRLSDETLRVLGELPDEPFMVFVGAFRRVKGVNELLAAYESLDDPPPLVMIGTREPDSPATYPEGVRVILNAPHDAVLAAAGSANCLFGVMPSLLPEPFGTVVCEVMSCGKPVIGTRPGGHTDMIEDGKSGFLVPRGDVEALAAAMQELISDAELRQRLGAAAREMAKQFTPNTLVPRIENLYRLIISTEQTSDQEPDEDGMLRQAASL
jgi:glycosyltransferase involved in cell wall biosynthesis